MSQHQRHHDGHANVDAGLHFHLSAYVVSLETVALVESRKNTLQRGALIVAILPGDGVTRRRGEDATVLVKLDAHHAAVVGDLSAVLLVTFLIALAVQSIDRSRTSALQGLSIFFESTERIARCCWVSGHTKYTWLRSSYTMLSVRTPSLSRRVMGTFGS